VGEVKNVEFWIFIITLGLVTGLIILYQNGSCQAKKCTAVNQEPILVKGVCFCAEVPR
jgi:hypothetical protein